MLALRPVTAAVTATGLEPDPGGGLHGALDPYSSVVPYSKWQSLTAAPSGFTVAFKVAAVCVNDDATPVCTAGVRSARRPIPPAAEVAGVGRTMVEGVPALPTERHLPVIKTHQVLEREGTMKIQRILRIAINFEKISARLAKAQMYLK